MGWKSKQRDKEMSNTYTPHKQQMDGDGDNDEKVMIFLLMKENEQLMTMQVMVIMTNDNKQVTKLPTVKFNDTLYNMKADVL